MTISQQVATKYLRFFQAALPLAAGLLGLSACTTYQHQHLLEQGQITQETVAGAPFQHVLFRSASLEQPETTGLHIYIEGDGLPWRTPHQIASNPTSPHANMLHAMLADSEPALLLGRPCYYDVIDPLCDGRWWTSHRYSNEVVASMAAVVERLAEDKAELWLIGHSGGGTLAVLIAARLQRPVTVVTLAANLDVDAWTQHHGYSQLFGSLDPMTRTPRNPLMRELHWYGTNDTTILPEWSERYCAHWKVACLTYTGDHSDWLTQWPTLLQQTQQYVDAQNSQRMPAE